MSYPKILVITLSNIGDVILTIPAINCIKKKFPNSKIHLIIGERAEKCIQLDDSIEKIFVYRKKSKFREKISMINALRKTKYELIVDFKNSFLPVLLRYKKRTCLINRLPKNITHMCEKHIWHLKKIDVHCLDIDKSYSVEKSDKMYADKIFSEFLRQEDVIVAIAPGAKSDTKQWPKEYFKELTQELVEKYNVKILLLGDEKEKLITEYVSADIPRNTYFNSAGMTTIPQVAHLLTKVRLLISNDSAIMHLAWLMNTPVVSIFGPTDPKKYAPLDGKNVTIKSSISCVPCEKAQCITHDKACLSTITPDMVLTKVVELLKEGTTEDAS